MGGTANHLEQTKHWKLSLLLGPMWFRVSFVTIFSIVSFVDGKVGEDEASWFKAFVKFVDCADALV